VDAGITAVKTVCLCSPTHSPQDESSLFCAGLGTVSRYMKWYNLSCRIPRTHYSRLLPNIPTHFQWLPFPKLKDCTLFTMHYGCGLHNSGLGQQLGHNIRLRKCIYVVCVYAFNFVKIFLVSHLLIIVNFTRTKKASNFTDILTQNK